MTSAANCESGEFDAVAAAVAGIEGFLARGDVPGEGNSAFEFFRRMTFQRYRDALSLLSGRCFGPQGCSVRAPGPRTWTPAR
jgi:hypothetical protein